MKKLRFATLILALVATAAVSAQSAPRYIFYFIGDGMGMGPVMAAETYNRDVLQNPQRLLLMQMPVLGWSATYSASNPVTDSAAAGTALSTGHKTRNGMLGMDADTVSVNSIAHTLKDMGYGVGVVTTVSPDDATPAAFYAHVPSRKMFYEIGCQAADCGYEFIAGAGLRGLTDADGNPTDLLDRFNQAGVQVVYGPEGIAQIDSRRVLLLNTPGHAPNNAGYTIDSINGIINLPMITKACLDHLMQVSPDRFFMMVEGGNIDHALHGNDGGAAIKEILNFNSAIALAYDFYLQHPDETLIVVTADHDTGGMALGNNVRHYEADLEYFDMQRVSKEEFSNYCKAMLKSRRVYEWADMREYLDANFGFNRIPISAAQEEHLRNLFDDTFEKRNTADQSTLYASFNAFAAELFRLLNDAAGVGFTTFSHTGNPVPVFAVGDGCDLFKGFNNNIDIPARILAIVRGERP